MLEFVAQKSRGRARRGAAMLGSVAGWRGHPPSVHQEQLHQSTCVSNTPEEPGPRLGLCLRVDSELAPQHIFCHFVFNVGLRVNSEISCFWSRRQKTNHSASKMAGAFSQSELFFQLQMDACYGGRDFEAPNDTLFRVEQYLEFLQEAQLNTAQVILIAN